MAPNDVRRTVAKRQFFDALLDTDMSLRIKQVRPHSLYDAKRLAVKLEVFINSHLRRIEQKSHLHAAHGDFSKNDVMLLLVSPKRT